MPDPRIVIYASAHRPPDVYPRNYVPVFAEAHTARSWLDRMLNGRPFDRDGNILTFEPSPGLAVKLRCEQLDRVMSAPVSNEELRADYAQHILRFKFGTWDEIHTRDEPASDDGDDTPTPKRVKPERVDRVSRPDGYVTITELCATSGVVPMHARAALRASGRPKPDYGWAFAPNEIPAIKTLCGMK